MKFEAHEEERNQTGMLSPHSWAHTGEPMNRAGNRAQRRHRSGTSTAGAELGHVATSQNPPSTLLGKNVENKEKKDTNFLAHFDRKSAQPENGTSLKITHLELNIRASNIYANM